MFNYNFKFMKKILCTILLTFIVGFSFAQLQPKHHPRHFKMPNVDKMEYCVIDSLPLERITMYSPYDYSEDDGVIKLGEGQYLMEMPFKDKMIMATNKTRTKAIILYNSYAFGRHKEFNIKETDRRIVLWYQDDTLYCGYTYDKKYKVCKYFENYFERLQDFLKHHDLQ